MKETRKFVIFKLFIYIFMGLLAIICLVPIINILAISLSAQGEVAKGVVNLWPKKLTLDSYTVILKEKAFVKSFVVSVFRVITGTSINVVLSLLMAYPLSKKAKFLPGRNIFMWMLIFVMLFNGGLVPTYMLIKNLNLLDNYLVLILPGALPMFNVILIMNFIRMLPKSCEEAAIIDGAGYMQILTRIIFPLCVPSIATITLFSAVGHWNEYFAGIIYMNIGKYPLQTYLYSMSVNRDINNLEQALMFSEVNDKTLLSAQIFVAMIPILIIYPMLQKHFVKGIVLGSVKG